MIKLFCTNLSVQYFLINLEISYTINLNLTFQLKCYKIQPQYNIFIFSQLFDFQNIQTTKTIIKTLNKYYKQQQQTSSNTTNIFEHPIEMSSRLKCCVAFLSIVILCSAGYMAYHIFLSHSKSQIEIFNRIRLYIFFGQHIITLFMLFLLLRLQQNQNLIKWMFQLSSINLIAFTGGQIYAFTHGGRLFGSYVIQTDFSEEDDPIYFFELNFLTLYYQIMTNFVMFFIISGIGLIIIRFRAHQEEQRYEFMIDNLHSQDYVEDRNHVGQKKQCSICLNDLQAQRVLKLPCQHYFHKQCLKDWLKRSQVCPLCRDDIQQSLGPSSPAIHINHAQIDLHRNQHINNPNNNSIQNQLRVVMPYPPPRGSNIDNAESRVNNNALNSINNQENINRANIPSNNPFIYNDNNQNINNNIANFPPKVHQQQESYHQPVQIPPIERNNDKAIYSTINNDKKEEIVNERLYYQHKNAPSSQSKQIKLIPQEIKSNQPVLNKRVQQINSIYTNPNQKYISMNSLADSKKIVNSLNQNAEKTNKQERIEGVIKT